MTVASLPVI